MCMEQTVLECIHNENDRIKSGVIHCLFGSVPFIFFFCCCCCCILVPTPYWHADKIPFPLIKEMRRLFSCYSFYLGTFPIPNKIKDAQLIVMMVNNGHDKVHLIYVCFGCCLLSLA